MYNYVYTYMYTYNVIYCTHIHIYIYIHMQQYIYVSLDMYTLHQLASFARDIFLLTSASMRRIPREESGNRSGTRDLREVTMDLMGKP